MRVESGLVRGMCTVNDGIRAFGDTALMCGVLITLLGVCMSPETMDYIRTFVSIISVAFAVYMGLRGNRKADNEDREQRIRSETRMDEKLNDVLAATKDTRDSVKEMQKDMKNQNDRLIAAESSIKSLNHRVDTIEHRLNGGT